MTSVVSFERRHVGQVAALWRRLHPDWTWLDEPAAIAELCEPSDGREHIRYVVLSGDAAIATVFASRPLDATWTRSRIIDIKARPEDIGAEWLDIAMASLGAADRGHPGTRQFVTAVPGVAPTIGPLLEENGFVRAFKVWRLAWSGEAVIAADPSAARFERYAGGSRETDAVIADLHNRSYRAAPPKPPADAESFWKTHAGLQMHEYLLARQDDRLIGYLEWWVHQGEAWILSCAVARTHWGTAIANTLVAKTIEILLELGHRKIAAVVRSNNTAAMHLSQQFGWTIDAELSDTFVRKL